jgi:hypothetical protein
MAIDYGTDIAAVDDLPDPEQTVSGTQNVAYAMARRWLTPTGGMTDVGETEDYPCIDTRQWLGGSFDFTDASTLADLEQQAQAVLLGSDPRISSCAVTATYGKGSLSLSAQGFGPQGPFNFVLQVSQLTTQLLFPGQS